MNENNNEISIQNDKILSQLEDIEILRVIKERTKYFSNSHDNKFKLLYVENLNFYSKLIGIENTISVNEDKHIKLKFLTKFDKFFDFICSNKNYSLKLTLFNLLIEFFNDKDYSDIIALSSENFILISKSLTFEDRVNIVLPYVLGLAYEGNNFESKILSANLLGHLAVDLSEEYCKRFIISHFYYLSDDINIKVRITVVQNISKISSQLNFKSFNKILNLYQNLCLDKNWQVRKATVEILSRIIQITKEKSKYTSQNDLFIKIFTNLIFDSQKEVRAECLKFFGEFIYSLEKSELNETFLNFYKNSLEEIYYNHNDFGLTIQTSYNDNLKYYCAYNFPSVIYCFGESYWPKLKHIYSNLANEEIVNVKQSMIKSFVEVAKIIGQDNLKNDLISIYNSFLSNKNIEVRNLSLSNLPNLLNLLTNEEDKSKYMKFLIIYEDDFILEAIRNTNWRKKVEALNKYSYYFHLFPIDTIWNKILRLCIIFCFDNVAKVRKKSGKMVSRIFKFLYEQNNYKINEKIFIILETFAYSYFYQLRILFIYITNEIIFLKEMYSNLLHKKFLDLVGDKVIDTRIALAKFIKKILKKGEFPEIIELSRILASDKSKAVRQYFDGEYVEQHYNEDSSFLFTNNISFIINEFKIENLQRDYLSSFIIRDKITKANSSEIVDYSEFEGF